MDCFALFFPTAADLNYRKRAVHKVIDEILTIKEVADYLKVAEKTIYRLAGSNKLPGFKVGGIWRFKQSDIESWIETRKTSSKNNDDPQKHEKG